MASPSPSDSTSPKHDPQYPSNIPISSSHRLHILSAMFSYWVFSQLYTLLLDYFNAVVVHVDEMFILKILGEFLVTICFPNLTLILSECIPG